jgi:hypothetical protein
MILKPLVVISIPVAYSSQVFRKDLLSSQPCHHCGLGAALAWAPYGKRGRPETT